MHGESFRPVDNSGANYDEENQDLEGFGGDLESYYEEQVDEAENGYNGEEDDGEERLDDWDSTVEAADDESKKEAA